MTVTTAWPPFWQLSSATSEDWQESACAIGSAQGVHTVCTVLCTVVCTLLCTPAAIGPAFGTMGACWAQPFQYSTLPGPPLPVRCQRPQPCIGPTHVHSPFSKWVTQS